MSMVPPRRTRQQRVAAVELPPGMWKTLWTNLQRGSVLLRLAMCAAAAIFLWAFTKAWDPPFGHRLGEVPHRNVIARVDFEQPDPAATNKARDEARRFAFGEYNQNPEPLVQLRGQLISDIGKVLQAKTLPEVDQTLWKQFQPPLAAGTPDPTPEEQAAQFERFREAFAGEKAMDAFAESLEEVMAPYEQRGLLKELPVEAQANTEKILVKNTSGFDAEVPVSDVRIKQAAPKLQQSLKEKLPSVEVAERAFAWFEPKLPETLTLDVKATQASQDKAAADVPEVTKQFVKGKDLLAEAGKPLDEDSLKLLRLEHEADLSDNTASERLHRSAAALGMFVALYTLAGFYLYRRDRRVVDELLRLVGLLGLFVLSVALA